MTDPDEPTEARAAGSDGVPSAGAPRLFADRYRLVGRRGSGLDVALFEAVDVVDDRTVAVRVVHPDVCARPGFAERFRETMVRVASVRHPNIVEVRDVGDAEWDGRLVQYLVAENLNGGSLRDLRDRGRTLSPSQAVMVGLDACRALDVAHRAGLVHGDIRPTSLVFGGDGRLRLVDLGLGALVAAGAWADAAAMGIDRARFASPEQAVGLPAVAKSDVYALSLCLIEAVTGSLPFGGDSTVATLANRVDRLMPVSADLGPLAAVLERAGRPDPDDRYTAAEFGRALVQAAEKLPRPAPIALLGSGLFAEAAPAPAVVPPEIGAPAPSVDEPLESVGTTAPEAGPPDDVTAGATVVAAATTVGSVFAPPDVTSVSAAPAGTPPSGPVPAPFAVPPPPVDDSGPILAEPRARRRLALVVGVVLLAALAGGVLAWFLTRPDTETVPDLAGLEQGEALNVISGFGWDVEQVTEPSDEIEPGIVVRTDPPAGASLERGDGITIVVSSGPAPRVLPDVTGLTVEQATAQLGQLGLVLQVTEQPNDETVSAGLILRWSVSDQPALVAGDTVLPGTLVSVVVSAGPAPRIVPDLRGLSLADAAARLAEVGLVAAQVPDEFSSDVAVGGVARQDPAPGAALERGSAVTVALSKGPDLVVIPPLAGLTPTQAAEALAGVGLAVGQVKGDPAGVNILSEVNGRSITAGESFPRGTAIDLTFGVPAG